jgi:hypothetical protein
MNPVSRALGHCAASGTGSLLFGQRTFWVKVDFGTPASTAHFFIIIYVRHNEPCIKSPRPLRGLGHRFAPFGAVDFLGQGRFWDPETIVPTATKQMQLRGKSENLPKQIYRSKPECRQTCTIGINIGRDENRLFSDFASLFAVLIWVQGRFWDPPRPPDTTFPTAAKPTQCENLPK